MSIGLEEILAQQKATNRLLVILIQRMWPESIPQKDLVAMLGTVGLSSGEIAELVGTSPATVEATKSRERKNANRTDEQDDSGGGVNRTLEGGAEPHPFAPQGQWDDREEEVRHGTRNNRAVAGKAGEARESTRETSGVSTEEVDVTSPTSAASGERK